MWRNVVLSTAAVVAAGILGGCTAGEKQAAAATASAPLAERPAANTAKPQAAASTAKKKAAGPAAAPTATPSPPAAWQDVLPLVKADTAWLDDGRTFLARREQAASNDGVPLFRQAIVLASVRAGLAGTPAAPQAEFRNGLITLTFDRGTPQQIAASVNKTLDGREVSRLRVVLPP
jgi:hypothetical protein